MPSPVGKCRTRKVWQSTLLVLTLSLDLVPDCVIMGCYDHYFTDAVWRALDKKGGQR